MTGRRGKTAVKTGVNTNSETEDFFDWLRGVEGGFSSQVKDLGDGFYAASKPLLFHWTLIMGEIGNKVSYLDRWCYETQEQAEAALRGWNVQGEPEGWHRHPASGRRRSGGDLGREYNAL